MSYAFRGRRRAGGGRQKFSSAPTAHRGPKKETIHPSRFVKAAVLVQEEAYVPRHTFNDFSLDELLKRNVAAKGFSTPSPIQDQAIPIGIEGKDVVGIANTGTGKTLAFVLPVLQQLLTYPTAKALVMAPTRELAQQIEDEFRMAAKGSRIPAVLLIGGARMGPQLRDLSYGPRVVIGTPGRIKDHLERRSLDVSNFTIAVLDEVDRMLDMGFVRDMRLILGKMPAQRQSFFFSATLDSSVSDIIRTFSHEPITVSVKVGDTIDSVEQNVVTYHSKEQKIEKLHDLLNSAEVEKVIVFDATKRSAERLSKTLLERGFLADVIHGGKSQGQRQRALSKFKANQITVLVATDVAARGIDVADITHVINYSTPQSYADYVHRIGRTGRAGRQGHALTFIEA
jgi:ATP-dependent RNA helicase RhlE